MEAPRRFELPTSTIRRVRSGPLSYGATERDYIPERGNITRVKSESKTNPEYAAFEGLLKTVLSVPHSELKRRIEDDKKAKAKRKKRVKTSPVSRASSGHEG